FAVTDFAELGIVLPPRQISFDVTLEEKAMSNSELLAAGQASHIAGLQWRLSLRLLVPGLPLPAVPVSRERPRGRRFGRPVPAVPLYMLYFGVLLTSRDLLEDGKLPAGIGLWWVHLLFGAIAFAVYRELFSGMKGSRRAVPHA